MHDEAKCQLRSVEVYGFIYIIHNIPDSHSLQSEPPFSFKHFRSGPSQNTVDPHQINNYGCALSFCAPGMRLLMNSFKEAVSLSNQQSISGSKSKPKYVQPAEPLIVHETEPVVPERPADITFRRRIGARA